MNTTSSVAEMSQVSKQEICIIWYTFSCLVKVLATCFMVKHHASLWSIPLLPDVRAKMEDLPFDGNNPLHSTTDEILANINDSRKQTKNLEVSQPVTHHQQKEELFFISHSPLTEGVSERLTKMPKQWTPNHPKCHHTQHSSDPGSAGSPLANSNTRRKINHILPSSKHQVVSLTSPTLCFFPSIPSHYPTPGH